MSTNLLSVKLSRFVLSFNQSDTSIFHVCGLKIIYDCEVGTMSRLSVA